MSRLSARIAGAWLLLSSLAFGQESRGIVYDFSATWCGPCQQMAPIVEKLAREGLPIQKVDIDQQRDLANRFRVEQIPTFVLLVDGKEVDRTTGRLTEADLRRMIARIPASQSPEPATLARTDSRAPATPMGIPVELGTAEPMPRPEPPPREEIRTAQEEPKRGLRDLIPFGRSQAAPASQSPVVRGNDSALASQPAAPPTDPAAAADPMSTSVRIRVITNGHIDLGSGTVISSQPGLTQILTCAHIFKEFAETSRIEVDVFEHGRSQQYIAKLVKFDDKSDLGLISIPLTNPVPAAIVGGRNAAPRVGEPVAAIGCSGGEEPTRQQSRVTDIDKYDGPHNILCTGVPVRGRSGGGLFNRNGEIIGVCSAADEQEQRGFFSGLLAIHALLDTCGLTSLYSQPEAPATTPAATPGPAQLASGAREMPSQPMPASVPAIAETSAQELHPAAIPTSTQEPMDVATGDAEVVVIIRDRRNPGGTDRVVIIHEASPKFMSYLSGELGGSTLEMRSLGANDRPGDPPIVPHPLRTAERTSTSERSFSDANRQLQPTTLSQPMIPQRFVRSK
jgi:thiol-disulfide isomerase/thioredoxin